MNRFAGSFERKYDFTQITNGEQIKANIQTTDYWLIKDAEKMLNDSEDRHNENKQKKWVVMLLGLIFGGLVGYYLPTSVYDLLNSKYDRTTFDTQMEDLFGQYYFEDVITDEALLISYSYNVQEPRFYSKYAAQ
jgi:hypothetical protein